MILKSHSGGEGEGEGVDKVFEDPEGTEPAVSNSISNALYLSIRICLGLGLGVRPATAASYVSRFCF